MGWNVKGTSVNGSGMLTCAAAAVRAARNTTDAARMPVVQSLREASLSINAWPE
jgi:hypothetical protein